MSPGLNDLRIAAELARRQRDGISMFRALGPDLDARFPDQAGLFSSQASELLIRGGNRCVAGSQTVFDPVAGCHLRVDQIDSGFHVWSFNPDTGRREIRKAGRPFQKGVGHIYEFRLSNGQSFRATMGHCVLTDSGWLPLGVACVEPLPEFYACHLVSTADNSLPVFQRDVPRYWQTVADSLSGCRQSRHSRGAQPHLGQESCQGAAPSRACAPTHSHVREHAGDLACTASYSRSCISASHQSIQDDDLLMEGLFDACENRASSPPCSQPSAFGRCGRQSAGESSRPPRTISASDQSASRSALHFAEPHVASGSTQPSHWSTPACGQSQWHQVHREGAGEQLRQRQSSDFPSARLVSVESVSYIEEGIYYDFTVEGNANYEIAGVLHHNSSKSMCAAALFASIARDKPICTWDGRMIETRRPWQKGRPLVMWIIGLQLNHIGQTIYRLLFKAGAYKIIRDLNTGEFRAYRPWDKSDVARYNETKPSFPLIPPSEIEQKGWSWHQKASRQFEVCKLKNGTEIWTFASTADVKQGDPVDVIWIDEAISNPDHYEEWQMRLPDVKGRIFWSSWPRKGNPALVRLTERAAEQREEYEKGLRTKINVEEFLFTFSGNPFIDEEEKQKVREGLSEEQLRARDLGEYDLDNMKIYPWFDASIHRAIGRIPAEDDTIGRILRDNNGVPPTDWTHELTLDPGTAKPAILLCAIPPQELWEEGEPWFVPYKEFYKARQTASDLAKEIKQYTQGKGITFQRFIIDGQAARITPMGFAGTIGDHYSKAFEKEGLYCDMTGQYFTPGSPDFSQRVMVVENWLRMRRTRPQLRIVVENCKQLVWQMSHNQKHVAENKVEEKEAKNQFNDVRVCFDPKTEVLTADGWKAWPEVSDNDSFATVHMQTGELEYQLPSALVCKEHSGEMIEFNGHKLRGMVTPDHRMVSYPLGCHDIPEFRQACDLRTQDRLRIKPDLWRGQEYESVLVDRVYEGRDQQKEVDPGDMAEFLGWYAAEGCKSLPRCPGHGWRVHLSQIKPHGKELLWSLLCQLPWKFRPDGDGYSCSSKQLWCYLERIGVGGDCYSKEVPGWIKWSSSSIIRRYVTGFVLGDGWQDKGRERCVSASKKLADGIQELYFKLGTASSVKTRPATTATIRGKTYNCREQHVVSEWTSEKAGLYSHDSKRNWSYVPYEGMVYCATVPNGTLVVRREGAPLVAGNCLEYWASRNPQYVLRKQVERRIVTPYDRYCKWKGERFSSRGPATGVTFGGGLR